MHLIYPPLEVGPEYAMGTMESPGQEVDGQSPLEMMGGSTVEQFGCYVAAWNMVEAGA